MKYKLQILAVTMLIGVVLLGCSTAKLSPTGVYGSGSVVGTNASVTYVTNQVGVTNALGAVILVPVVTAITNQAVLVDGLILYGIDNAIGQAYVDLDGFVAWEANNRATLTPWPSIKSAADYIRLNAKSWVKQAIAARESYRNNPTVETKSLLDTAIKVLTDSFANAKVVAVSQPIVPLPASLK